MLLYLIGLVISGLVVGALGRLVIPGPNPMSIGKTILIGIVGSLVAGLIANALFNRGAGLILAVLCTAAIVYGLERYEQRNRV